MSASDTDAKILRLFREWIARHRAAEQVPRGNEHMDEFDAAVARINDVEHAIADTPVTPAPSVSPSRLTSPAITSTRPRRVTTPQAFLC
jgi:hypothetical protein